jgi:integrase
MSCSYSHPMPPRKRRQRGHIEQLPSGNYRAVAYAGVDLLTRRPRYHRKTVKTYDDAKKALIKLQSEIDEDRAPKSDVTVRQAPTSGSTSPSWKTPPASGIRT